MTQTDMVLRYMHENGSITQDDADRDLGCKRLAARIKDLKKAGMSIDVRMEKGKNRWGQPTHYARYSLGGEKQ